MAAKALSLVEAASMADGVTTNVEVVTVTPELASDWLGTMGPNRKMSNIIVERYANFMKAGHWELNGESIKFDTRGRLIDGQHRLAAVVMSGVPIETYVVYGIDRKAFSTMDTGKRRAPGDYLALRGYANPHAVSATAALVYGFREYGRLVEYRGKTRAVYPSHDDLHQMLINEPEILNSIAKSNAWYFMGTPRTIMATLHYLMWQIDPQKADDFFELLRSGAGLEEGHPVLLLRNRLIANAQATRKMHREEIGVIFVHAWNAYRAGRSLKNLRAMVGEKFPELK